MLLCKWVMEEPVFCLQMVKSARSETQLALHDFGWVVL